MSENEKLGLTAEEAVGSATPQESDPLGKASDATVDEIIEEIKKETVQKEREVEKTTEGKETETKGDTAGVPEVHKINAKKLGLLLTAGALCVFSISAIGIMGSSRRGDAKAEDPAVQLQFAEEDSDVEATMNWWKAGIEQSVPSYDEAVVTSDEAVVTTTLKGSDKADEAAGKDEGADKAADEAEGKDEGAGKAEGADKADKAVVTTAVTTKAPKKSETTAVTTTEKAVTTTKKPAETKVSVTSKVTTKKKAPEYEVKEIEPVTFYLTSNVNLRKAAGTQYDRIVILQKGSAVTATHKCSNGWYKVTAGDKVGYIIGDYVTTEKPVVTTTKKVTTTAPKKTEAAKADKTAKTDKAEAEKPTLSEEPVIKFTDEELVMFYYVVEGEVGGCSEESKLAVANVIINRVKSPRFANSLSGVLTARNQFTAINNYYSKRRAPTASTKDCVNRALHGEDNSSGALFFYSRRYCSASTANWFESMNFCFEIDGQRYFK